MSWCTLAICCEQALPIIGVQSLTSCNVPMSLVAHRICYGFHTEAPPLSSPQCTKSISSTHLSFPSSSTFHASCTCFSKQFKTPLYVSCENNDANAYDISDTDNGSSEVNDGSGQTKKFTSTKLLEKLRKYGISGILSYGILNTVYYLTTFSFVWFYVAPSPGRLGYAAAVERFVKVMVMVWVGSQVTKLARAAGTHSRDGYIHRDCEQMEWWYRSCFVG